MFKSVLCYIVICSIHVFKTFPPIFWEQNWFDNWIIKNNIHTCFQQIMYAPENISQKLNEHKNKLHAHCYISEPLSKQLKIKTVSPKYIMFAIYYTNLIDRILHTCIKRLDRSVVNGERSWVWPRGLSSGSSHNRWPCVHARTEAVGCGWAWLGGGRARGVAERRCRGEVIARCTLWSISRVSVEISGWEGWNSRVPTVLR